MKPKRKDMIAGTILTVNGPDPLGLDIHYCVPAKAYHVNPGQTVEVLGPPKRDRDGINLVPVKVHIGNGLYNTYSCYYIYLLKYTSL